MRTVKTNHKEEGIVLVGAEDKCITKYKYDFAKKEPLEIVDVFKGHSSGIRSIETNKGCTKLMTGCEDHSLRVWDYHTCKPEHILSGHRDVVTGGHFLNDTTYVSCSWDMTLKFWKI